MYKSPLAIGLIIVTLVLLAVGLAAWQFVSIKSTGTPLGPAVRLPDYIGQIICTTERYLPTLHRNPGKDRFRLDLLVVSLDDPTRQETFTLLRQQQSNALQPMTKILGGDGDVVWVQALDLFAVNLKTKRLLRLADLKKLNPELELFLNTARFAFDGKLIAISHDQQQAYAFPAETFKATPCAVPRPTGWVNPAAEATDWLCAGVILSPTEWLGAVGAKDQADNYRPGSRLPLDLAVNAKTETRHLYRGQLKPEDTRSRLQSVERISATEYRDAAFVRSARSKAGLRLSAPDSVLLTYRSALAPNGTLQVARIHPDGEVHWTADTGIGRLLQILPDANVMAFIGERPPVPNKVSEPILVHVNTATGAITTLSLWR